MMGGFIFWFLLSVSSITTTWPGNGKVPAYFVIASFLFTFLTLVSWIFYFCEILHFIYFNICSVHIYRLQTDTNTIVSFMIVFSYHDIHWNTIFHDDPDFSLDEREASPLCSSGKGKVGVFFIRLVCVIMAHTQFKIITNYSYNKID